MGWELVAGYLLAWVVRKAQRVGRRADAEADRVLDTALDRLHDCVSAKLGDDPAVTRLLTDGGTGTVSSRTAERVRLALEDAAETDPAFATSMRTAIEDVRAAEARVDRSLVVHGNVEMLADRGSVVALQVNGDIHIGGAATDPSR
jgi:hypothetical protein